MIQQFQLVLAPPTGVRIPQAWAYRLYGWLMAQLPGRCWRCPASARGAPHCAFPAFFAGKTGAGLDGQPAERGSPAERFSPSDVCKGDPAARTDPAGRRSPCFPGGLCRRTDPLWPFLRRKPRKACFSVALCLQAVRPLCYFSAGSAAFAKPDCALEHRFPGIRPYG